jgi:hypothetical protein
MIPRNPAVEFYPELITRYPDFPPRGWELTGKWGDGYALREPGGLRLLIDASCKSDGKLWLHVSVSRKKYPPSWDDLKRVKKEFIGDNHVAVIVFPEASDFVNIHPYCHHLWHCIEAETVPNFTGEIAGIKSI